MTDKPWVVRYFEEDMIGVVCREKTRLIAEKIMMEYNDHGWVVDVQHDPHHLWIVPDETHWRTDA